MIMTSVPAANLQGVSESANLPDGSEDVKDDILREKSREFEAVFIGQMLKFSGFDKALTMGGGKDASAFTGMYIQEFAEAIADQGGFGLADKIYDQMARLHQDSISSSNEGVTNNVFSDKL